MGLGADADWELQDRCPEHGRVDDPECKAGGTLSGTLE